MKVKFTVNKEALVRELKKSLSSKNSAKNFERNIKSSDGQLLSQNIEKVKKNMIQAFLKLPITQEIMGGPDASNISGTLGGYGNLFSFIGFSEGDDPIAPIISLLEQTSYRFTNMSKQGSLQVIVTMPSAKDIFSVTPLPWAPGISWAQRIEVGLSGLGQYLQKSSPASRSGGGIQTDNQVRAGGFRNSSYISNFINVWKKEFLNLSKGVSVSS